MNRTTELVIDYLNSQGINVSPTEVYPSFLDPKSELVNKRVPKWTRLAAQTDETRLLTALKAESMSLASMAAVEQLRLTNGLSVLDSCAAPGMKSLYAKLSCPEISLVSTDLSYGRLKRLERLFSKHGLEPTAIKQDATKLSEHFEPEFDRILIDAPCSGEGLILAGDKQQLKAWSTAKVKRLQQLQVKILKSAWSVLKPGGLLVYSTCTLNRNENERAVRKALKVDLDILETELSLDSLPLLKPGAGWRILPSPNSIGFFIAVLEKAPEEI